jgi:hypothetical protein
MNELLKDKIFTIKDFLSEKDCLQFIDLIKNKKTVVSFTNTGYFDNDKFVDMKLTDLFFLKLKNLLGDLTVEKLQIVRANSLIMTGKFNENQEFSLHTDTGLYFNRTDKEKSRFTLLIYLNDNFDGGETIFFDDDFNELLRVVPTKGSALLFDIEMWHKGNKITKGIKYWIGCEIVGRYN